MIYLQKIQQYTIPIHQKKAHILINMEFTKDKVFIIAKAPQIYL